MGVFPLIGHAEAKMDVRLMKLDPLLEFKFREKPSGGPVKGKGPAVEAGFP